MKNADAIRKRSEATVRPMVQEFDNIKGKLYEIAENVYPLAKRGITDEVDLIGHTAEQFNDDKVLNTAPFEALRKGAAGFLVNLMNPALKWFHLEPSTGLSRASRTTVRTPRASTSSVWRTSSST